MKHEHGRGRDLQQEIEELRDATDKLRHQVVDLERRVAKLELQQELWQEPSAAGDEAVSG